jgi:hypothetical protein
LDTVNKVFLAIEFKETQDTRSNFVERAAAAAQDQYMSLLTGLQAVGRVNGWQAQQIVFVGGTCGSVHVESFNKNMKVLGVLESKLNPVRQKLGYPGDVLWGAVFCLLSCRELSCHCRCT